MCPSNGIGDFDILDLAKDVWRKMAAERLSRNEVDSAAQGVFEQLSGVHEVAERRFIGMKLDEQVHVAFRRLLTAHERSEQPYLPNAEFRQPRPMFVDPMDDLGLVGDRSDGLHAVGSGVAERCPCHLNQ
jgi:hypothetical protein